MHNKFKIYCFVAYTPLKRCVHDKAINFKLIVHLVGCFIEYLKMHGTTNPKFINAKQAEDIYTYKNMKQKLHKSGVYVTKQ
jgi:hypothetical protein